MRLKKKEKPKSKPRKCLRCDETFDSEGPHHRICDRCKTANSKLGLSEITFSRDLRAF